MNRHLTDEQLAEVIQDRSPEDAPYHLDQCAACNVETETLLRAVGGLRKWVVSRIDRRDSFWEQQRRDIRTRLEEKSPAGVKGARWVWICSTCMVLLIAMFAIRRAPETAPVASMDPDHELLIEVQRLLRRDLPAALEPAAFLTQDLAQAAAAISKETSRNHPMRAGESK